MEESTLRWPTDKERVEKEEVLKYFNVVVVVDSEIRPPCAEFQL